MHNFLLKVYSSSQNIHFPSLPEAFSASHLYSRVSTFHQANCDKASLTYLLHIYFRKQTHPATETITIMVITTRKRARLSLDEKSSTTSQSQPQSPKRNEQAASEPARLSIIQSSERSEEPPSDRASLSAASPKSPDASIEAEPSMETATKTDNGAHEVIEKPAKRRRRYKIATKPTLPSTRPSAIPQPPPAPPGYPFSIGPPSPVFERGGDETVTRLYPELYPELCQQLREPDKPESK